MFEKILVVCVGNICRSPTGERLLQQHLPNKHIESAGIGTEKSGLTGKAADKTANELALLHGIDLSGHQAKQLTPTLCQNYDPRPAYKKNKVDNKEYATHLFDLNIKFKVESDSSRHNLEINRNFIHVTSIEHF